MALSFNLYARKVQRKTGEDLGANSGCKTARMAKLWQFLQSHPKAAFSEKVQRLDKNKFFKNRPKSGPHLNGPTALWPERHYPLINMQLKLKHWTRFWRKEQLQNCPNCQLMAIFAKSPKTRIFWKSAKGDQGKFFKNRLKSSHCVKGPKGLWRKWHYPLISMHL